METEGTKQPESKERPTEPQQEPEQIVWTAHPSQIINFGAYALCLVVIAFAIAALVTLKQPEPFIFIGLGVLIGIALIVALAKGISTRARLYQVTSERIKLSEGVFSRKTEEVELYRVRDYKLTQPFWLRLFGLGNIVVSTTDNANPIVMLEAIRDPNGHREQIRKYVESCRDRKRVRITEFES